MEVFEHDDRLGHEVQGYGSYSKKMRMVLAGEREPGLASGL